jgi:predicted phosphodiesterase
MQTSGLFRTHSHTVNFKSYGKPIRLVIFGDVHRDSPNHADGTWKDFLAHARGLKDAYFLGMGDYLDATSASEREMLGHITPKMHETFNLDIPKLVNAKVELMAKELAFMKGRLIGLINGNHYYQFGSDINSDQKLCEALDCRYLGVCSFIRLYLHGQGRHHAIDIFAHHGKGAARMVGGSLNRVAQMVEGAEADVYIMGHDHKRGAVPMSPRLFLTHTSKKGLEVKHKEVWAVRSGSFLASYRDGEVNYNVDAARGPCSLGHVELLITPKSDGEIKIQSLV